MDASGTFCIDINECSSGGGGGDGQGGSKCDDGQSECRNSLGSYKYGKSRRMFFNN